VFNSGDLHGDVVLGDGANKFDGAQGSMNGFGVTGGDQADIIKGGADDDIFIGGKGADKLNGRGGDDLITGGRDVDRLTGGAGADTFQFLLADSPGRFPDLITDFDDGEQDVIDLSAIDANSLVAGDQAFTFIGTAAFTAAGQLRYTFAGGVSTVLGDVSGDGVADFSVTLAGVSIVTGEDFVL
jgi:Ca2+-binding RTX toxin-like protein